MHRLLFYDLVPDYLERRSAVREAHHRCPPLELAVFEANEIGRRFDDAYGFEIVERRIEESTGEAELRLRLGREAPAAEPPDGRHALPGGLFAKTTSTRSAFPRRGLG